MSARFGSPKQLLKVNGKSMLEHAIAAATGAGIVSPVLVLGAFADDILRNVASVKKCQTIFNHEFADGQATSLKAGVRAIMGTCDAAVFMLADQPLVDAQCVVALMDRFKRYQPDALYPVYRQRRGNPVIIKARLFPRLLNATGDQGARFLFADRTLDVHAHEVQTKAFVTDIDTWDDYLLISRPKPASNHQKDRNR